MFYKAAFYDSSAHMGLERRFNIHKNWDLKNTELQLQFLVKDCEEIIYQTEIIKFTKQEDLWHADDKEKRRAEDWLINEYPDWENVLAYWD